MTAENDADREALKAVLRWAEQCCPHGSDETGPCPLCGASVENLEACKSAENTFPPDLLQTIRLTLSRPSAHARQTGGPVAWQKRVKIAGQWTSWMNHEREPQPGGVPEGCFEKRPLYAHPAPPAPQPGVKVKGLEWSWEPPYSVARAMGGHYAVERWEDDAGAPHFDLIGSFVAKRDGFSSADDAKAAAQADYERRILSALSLSPSGWDAGAFEAGAEAMRKAIVAKTEDFGYLAVEEVMTLPLPTPPAGEG